MIGGYLYSRSDPHTSVRLESLLDKSFKKIEARDNGYIFYDDPFQDNRTTYLVSDEMIALSQDILVAGDSEVEYRLLNMQNEFPQMFEKQGTNSFNRIASDFRMVILYRTKSEKSIFLVSHRAGSGRIYYHKLESGILFSSDLRFLLRIVPLDVSNIGIYSVLKYGAIPEPLTISTNVSAVPPAHYMQYDLHTGKHAINSYFKFKFTYIGDEAESDSTQASIEPIKGVLHKSARFLGRYNPAMLLSGGIDSSLYSCYLSQGGIEQLQAFYCAFGEGDPEISFANNIAKRIDAHLTTIMMHQPDALCILNDASELTDHPFSDLSSMPIVFLLKHIKDYLASGALVIECNGGDDCFGFVHLASQAKFDFRHSFPRSLKRSLSSLLKIFPYWKWESEGSILARLSSLAEVHEATPLDYFLVCGPVNYLELKIPRQWDDELSRLMQTVFAACGENYNHLGYKAKMTIRQLLHVNSRVWTAKALSVGENLGLRLIYPYIWHDVLVEQGKLPWNAKIHNGIVKWPLRRLLEEFMPTSFIYRKKSGFDPPLAGWLTARDFNHQVRDILTDRKGYIGEIVPLRIFDEILSDALNGKKLRSQVLEFLWGAIFTEVWIRRYKHI